LVDATSNTARWAFRLSRLPCRRRTGDRGCGGAARQIAIGSTSEPRAQSIGRQDRGGGIEALAFVLDRGRRRAGFDQLDAPAVHDLVVG
jgi:hypothetical protein